MNNLDHSSRPFIITFAGRIESCKGIFDILEMAKILKDYDIEFNICGDGTDYESLQDRTLSNPITQKSVKLHGKLKRPELLKIYNNSHVVIVPTRSNFSEGLPKAVIEAVLLEKPVVTSKLSNALDVLGDAIVKAEPENINSYVKAIQSLVDNKQLYLKKQKACIPLKTQFFDETEGLTAVMQKTI